MVALESWVCEIRTVPNRTTGTGTGTGTYQGMSPRISGPEFLAQSCLWPITRVSGSALKPGSWPLALLRLVAPSSGQNLWPETLANSGPDMAQNDRYIIDNKLSTEAGAAWDLG